MKHFSFDLWLTIIKSNPLFKSKRVTFFHEHYNFSNHSEKEIKSVFRKVDLMCNQVNESVGFNLDTKEMYLMVLYLLNENSIDYSEIDIYTNEITTYYNKFCVTTYENIDVLIIQYYDCIFEYKVACPYCYKPFEGGIGGEHSQDFDMICPHCRAEIDYDVDISVSYKQRKVPKKV